MSWEKIVDCLLAYGGTWNQIHRKPICLEEPNWQKCSQPGLKQMEIVEHVRRTLGPQLFPVKKQLGRLFRNVKSRFSSALST